MAPTFRPAKKARFLFNNADLSPITNSMTVVASAAALKTTCFQSDDETYVAGIVDGTAKYDGIYDVTKYPGTSRPMSSTGALDMKISGALQATTQPIITFSPEGDSLGRRNRMFRQETVAYTAQSPIADALKWAGGGQLTGPQDAGVSLFPLANYTSTGSTFAGIVAGTGVDCGLAAGTTGGGVGHFHMTAQGTISTLQARIQHSSAGASWADLIAFSSCISSTKAASAQRSTVAGTVKRFTRAIIPVYTGSAKTATIAVAFARRSTRGV